MFTKPSQTGTQVMGAGSMNDETGREQMLRDALNHLQAALSLLDLASAPPHIGAHVDLATHELDAHVPAAQVIPMDERASRH
jgi:hypothetical protein